jgi:hypothetical protein
MPTLHEAAARVRISPGLLCCALLTPAPKTPERLSRHDLIFPDTHSCVVGDIRVSITIRGQREEARTRSSLNPVPTPRA